MAEPKTIDELMLKWRRESGAPDVARNRGERQRLTKSLMRSFRGTRLLAPGVLGILYDTKDAITIPVILAIEHGTGAVSRYLNSLPTDRRIEFPTVISERLREMLLRRGFRVLSSGNFHHRGEKPEVLVRDPQSNG